MKRFISAAIIFSVVSCGTDNKDNKKAEDNVSDKPAPSLNNQNPPAPQKPAPNPTPVPMTGDTKPSADAQPVVPEAKAIIADITREGIVNYLKSGAYKNWTKDKEIHEDKGPHGKVRMYFNDLLVDGFNKQVSEYPIGASSVKELYDNDSKLMGYAVGIKVEKGTAAESWLWYEGFDPDYNLIYGKGHAACAGCHAKATDYVIARPNL